MKLQKKKNKENIINNKVITNTKKTKSNKVVDRTINSAASTIGRKLGNQLFKGLFKQIKI